MPWTVQRDTSKWLNVFDENGEIRFQVAWEVDPEYKQPIRNDIEKLVACYNAAVAISKQVVGSQGENCSLVPIFEALNTPVKDGAK